MSLQKWVKYFAHVHRFAANDTFADIMNRTEAAYFNGKVCPLRKDLFRSLEIIEPDQVKVVIVGQDPGFILNEEGLPEADGLAFSSRRKYDPNNSVWYKSMEIIIETIKGDEQGTIFENHSLEQWVAQGVLLLNASLIAAQGVPDVHPKVGWGAVIRTIVHFLSLRKKSPIVFMLWGDRARAFRRSINTHTCTENGLYIPRSNILAIESSHPRAMKKSDLYIKDVHPFATCNQFLAEYGDDMIDWNLYSEKEARRRYHDWYTAQENSRPYVDIVDMKAHGKRSRRYL